MDTTTGQSIHGPWGFSACEQCKFMADAYIRALDRQNEMNRKFLEAVGHHNLREVQEWFIKGQENVFALRRAAGKLRHHRLVKGC
jgi:hypothetical protein